MTPREIIEKKVFGFDEVRPVPYHMSIDPEVRQRLDAHYGGPQWHDRLVSYLEGGHWVGETGARQLPNGLVRNPFGYDYRSGSIMHVERLALPEPTLDGFDWPEADSLADWDLLHRGFDASPAFRHCGMIYGFFERASFMRGMENLLMDMVENPQFVHDLMDEYLRIRLEVIDRIVERVPCEAIADGGDDCGQRGPLMGLARWREFIKPRLTAVIDHCHAKGFPVIAHMCGNVAPLIDDLLEMKLDALESLQPEAMDVYAVKAKAAGKMVLIGGLGTQQVLPRGTPDEVAAETRRLCDEMGAGGGYILGAAKPLMPDVPTENAVAFIEATLDQ